MIVKESIIDVLKPKKLTPGLEKIWQEKQKIENLDFDGAELLYLDKEDDQIVHAKDGKDIEFEFDISEDCIALEDAHIVWNSLSKKEKKEIAEILLANIEYIDPGNNAVEFNDGYEDIIDILKDKYGEEDENDDW